MRDPRQPDADRLGRELVTEYLHGRRQRLYPLFVAQLRRWLEELATQEGESTLAGAFLLVQATLVHHAHRTDLAAALARDLGRTMPPRGDIQAFLEPEVALTYAMVQQYRTEAVLPAAIGRPNRDRLADLVGTLHEALQGLTPDFWDALVLSSYRAALPTVRGGLVVAVPPRTLQPAGEERPAPGPFPVAAAATPPATTVVDARAERLWWDECLAAIVGVSPTLVAVVDDPDEDPELAALLARQVRDLLPRARLVRLAALAEPHDESFDHVLLGPSFAALAGLAAMPDLPRPRVVPAAEAAPFADVTPWPLACYRRVATDADIVIPAAGRDGAGLARDLQATASRFPCARLRLDGLTATQASELVTATPRPAPPRWSLAVSQPNLPGDAAALRRAGLGSVNLQVGLHALPVSVVAPLAEALEAVGVRVQIEVDTTGLELAELVAEAARSQPEAIAWRGTRAEAAAERWARR